MPSLPDHFTSVAGLLDVIIVGVLLEGVVLAWAWRRSRRGPSPWELVFMLGAGLCLMGALRLSVAGAPMAWVAGLLAASGLVHALDLRLRRRHDRGARTTKPPGNRIRASWTASPSPFEPARHPLDARTERNARTP